MKSERGAADALWLDTLQRLSSRAAHELKGALNGASVNLEVVASRAERPGMAASAVSSYAVAARGQLDDVITMADALLSMARRIPEPVDLGPLVRRMKALLAPAAKADGRALEIEGPFEHLGTTSADGNTVRYAIGSLLLAATQASRHVRCEPVTEGEEPTLRIETCDGAAIPCDGGLIAAAAESGIRIQAEASAISIRFPRWSGEARRGV